ncbi:hypothetical protein P43SY_004829 [Pythium insidiosum]|uniref:TKL protein kinase n=1 Tax=Pythium insidiosum TaxID=114742 RepID=A0AAD5QC98_PYTIN|nr:hypothetical protein P43SY_004829 [Pythium insidiosum]
MHPRRASASASPPPPRHPQPATASSSSSISSSGALSAFSLPPTHAFDELTPVSSTTISSPSGAAPSHAHSLAGDGDPLGAGLGPRKSSSDDLAAEVSPSPPCTTVSEARLLYRKWRAGSGLATSPDAMNDIQVPDALSRSPFEQPGYARTAEPSPAAAAFLRSPEQLPRIAEKTENMPLFANSFDPDTQARLLSEQLSEPGAAGSSPSLRPQGGSFGNSRTPESASSSNLMKRARSYQALDDLEKNGYFPAAPTPSALGVQRGLKDSVVNDMCRAVVKHMVGDLYVSSSGQHGTKKVLNHLYEPVLQSVQSHFRRLPARYALSVNPDDVPMHMRLLAKHQRNPDEININVQLKKDDDGNVISNVCEVVVVSPDRDSLLDGITRALTSMKGSIMDADVMTTHDGVTLDRFVVKGSFLDDDRQIELKRRIEDNLARLSLGDDTEDRPSVEAKSAAAAPTDATSSSESNLAEKLGVLKMVDQHEIKDEWSLNMAELKIDTTVGTGRSGNTYSALWRGTRVAVKVVDASAQNAAMSEDLLNEFHREVAVVSKLRHPNIVLFLGAAISPPKYCLVFEFMQNGTLTDLIRSRKAPIDFFRVATEIAMGMNYLHLCSIMHRDLKSGNVLLDAHGTVKISDFGLSCVLDISGSHDLTAETGTYRWMAPEVIRHEPYSTKADVYSFGVVLWEMIAKDQPFRGLTPIQAAFAVARQQMRPALPRHTPLKIGELVEHCWHQDPNRRPDFSAILEALPLVKLSLKKRDFKNLGFALPSLAVSMVDDAAQLTPVGPTAEPLKPPKKHSLRTEAWSEHGSEHSSATEKLAVAAATEPPPPASRLSGSLHKLALLVVALQALWAVIVPLKNIASVVYPTVRPDGSRMQTLPYLWSDPDVGASFAVDEPLVVRGSDVVPLLKDVLDVVLSSDHVRYELTERGAFEIEAVLKLLDLDGFAVVSRYYALVHQSAEFPAGRLTPRAFTAPDARDRLMVLLRDTSDAAASSPRDIAIDLQCSESHAWLEGTTCVGPDGLPCSERDPEETRTYADVRLAAAAAASGLENSVALLSIVDFFHTAVSAVLATQDWAAALEDLGFNQTTAAALDGGLACALQDGAPYLLDRDAFLVGILPAQMDTAQLDSCVAAELVVAQFYVRALVLQLLQDALTAHALFNAATPRVVVPSNLDAILAPVFRFNLSVSSGARVGKRTRKTTTLLQHLHVATATSVAAQFKFDRRPTTPAGSSLRLLQQMAAYPDIVSRVTAETVDAGGGSAYDRQTLRLLGWVGSDVPAFKDSFTASSLAMLPLRELAPGAARQQALAVWDAEQQFAAWFRDLEATAAAPFKLLSKHLRVLSAARVAPTDDNAATRCQRALFKVLGKVALLALLEVSLPASYLLFMGETANGARSWLVNQIYREELVGETFSGDRVAFAYRSGASVRKDDGSAWVVVPLLQAMVSALGKDDALTAILLELDRSLALFLKEMNGNVNLPDAMQCKLSGVDANAVIAGDSLEEIVAKIQPGLQAALLDLVEQLPAIASAFRTAMTNKGLDWPTLSEEQLLGNAAITNSTEGRGPPGDWAFTVFTAGLAKFWPPKTPTPEAIERFRNATVCYDVLDTRRLVPGVRCFVEPQSVVVVRTEFRSERLREFFLGVWSSSIMLNTMAGMVVFKYLRKLVKAWQVTRFECLDLEVALQLNLQGLGVLSFAQSLLLLVASLPLLLSLHVSHDPMFLPFFGREKRSKPLGDVLVALAMTWFVKLGFDVCNAWISPKRPVDWLHLFRVRWLAIALVLVLRLVTPERAGDDAYVMWRLVLTCLVSLGLGAACTVIVFLPERPGKVVDADQKENHDAVVAALVKQNLPLNRYGVLGRTSKGWSKTGLIVEGWRLGRAADGTEVLRKDGGEIPLPTRRRSTLHSLNEDTASSASVAPASEVTL